MKSNEEKSRFPYVERDISWMYFNQRILLEAGRPEVPLLERLTFLGIYSNNLDEFSVSVLQPWTALWSIMTKTSEKSKIRPHIL